jgi:hypothetical protein
METELCDKKPPSAVCTHNSTKRVDTPPGSRHYKKLECANCGAFLRFLPKPETIERVRLNGYKLAQLTMCGQLDSFERQFVDSLAKAGNPKLTPRQQAVFDRIHAAYFCAGKGAITQNGNSESNGAS